MIRIYEEGKHYILEEVDETGRRVLFQPLHRIFLRSNLNAFPTVDDHTWRIPLGEQPSVSLQQITDHLAKYNIEYILDQTCNEIVAGVRERKKEFQRILKEGFEAKKRIRAADRERIESELSEGFPRKLTKLQIAAVNHLLTVRHGANFSVPGSGKTAVALAYYHLLRKEGEVDAFLVVGPASCFEPWEQEYELCFGRKAKSARLAGNTKPQRRELCLTAERYEFLLTTYHSAAKDVAELIRTLSRRRYLLILDESHYVKRPQGGKLADAVLRIAVHSQRRLILTGTPMPNGLPDLWSQLTFLWFDQEPLGAADDYLREVQHKEPANVLNAVRHRISPLFFRITKSQLDLPRPSFRTIKCEMSALQARLYRGVAARFLSQTSESPVDREALRVWRRARAVRLLQIASNPTLLRKRCDEFQLPPMDVRGLGLREAIDHYARYETPNKVTAVCKLVTEICRAGEKAIIWSTFVHNLQMLATRLHDFGPVVVHGGVPITSTAEEDFSRERLISSFRDDPRCQVLIANPAACAESISLHKVCHHAVYLDRSFNCAHYLQSLDRIHRLGLSKNQKTCYYLVQSAGSIDEVVHARLREKMKRMREVVESDLPGKVPGYWSEDLGDEEVVDLQQVDEHILHILRRSERQAG